MCSFDQYHQFLDKLTLAAISELYGLSFSPTNSLLKTEGIHRKYFTMSSADASPA
ncbi:MAG: hypothetical protein M3342_10890 [Bacteroidota bacterium]|nr:hypothetical protein [Bacteroidota bacterium]